VTKAAPEALCPHCDGTTWVFAEDGRGSVPCKCRDRRLAANRVQRVRNSLPALIRESHADLDRRPVVDLAPHLRRAIRYYADHLETHLEAGRGMWFYGGQGNGKTSAAISLAKETERRRRTASFAAVPDHLDKLRACLLEYTPDHRTEMVDKLIEVDLLVLDDLGAERSTDFALEQLYLIVDGRLRRKRSTIVTSNLSPDELERALGRYEGRRIVSRLHEMCGRPLFFDDLDHRRADAIDWEELATSQSKEPPHHRQQQFD
jgi:DNA replication protein DnaC